MRKVRMWKVAAVAALVCALGVGIGVGLAAVGEGGVIKACYSNKGAWRVISTSNPTENCKAGEQMLELYSKSGADAAFLNQSEADASYLGKTSKAADSDTLDGINSSRFVQSTYIVHRAPEDFDQGDDRELAPGEATYASLTCDDVDDQITGAGVGALLYQRPGPGGPGDWLDEGPLPSQTGVLEGDGETIPDTAYFAIYNPESSGLSQPGAGSAWIICARIG